MRWVREAAVVGVIVAMLAGCRGGDADRPAGGHGEVPDEIVVDFTTAESDTGRVRWRLTAPRADRFNDRRLFVMEHPRVEFYDEDGRVQSTLTSEKGEYDERTRDMLAYGNVVVVSARGDVLETDSLRYLNAQDRIVSESRVKLTRGDDVITGIGLEADHTLSSVDIKRNVRARIVDDDGRIDE